MAEAAPLTLPAPLTRPDPGPAEASLPRPLTTLIGREREIRAVVDALGQEHLRLLTLTGPGGIGKTRLAIAAASAIHDRFDHGVAFVSLASLIQSDLVLSTIATTLGIAQMPGRPPEQALIDALRHRRLLIVLDNMEHLVGAAPGLTDLLKRCPDVKLLVTSRVSLRVDGEVVHRIPPLTVPERSATLSLDDLGADALAVRLFVERAAAVDGGFSLTASNAAAVTEICRRLDGLPLAIELAVRHLRTLAPEAMLERMDRRLPLLTVGARDAPDRFQTMERAIAWSYDVLTEGDQRLLRLLSVFVGGFTLDAADAVATSLGMTPGGVVGGITSLIDQNLLQRAEGQAAQRYRMLETIREYGVDRLAAAGEERDARRAHATWFTDHALESERVHHRGRGMIERLHEVDAEHPNLRAALQWSIESGDAERALTMAGALIYYWYVRGHYVEGAEWYRRVLAMPEAASASADLRAAAWIGRCILLTFLQRMEDAITAERRATALLPEVDSPDAHGFVLGTRAFHKVFRGDFTGAEADGLASCQHYLRGSADHTILGLFPAARGAHHGGYLDRAAERYEELLVTARASDHVWMIGATLESLALLERARGNPEAARRYYAEALPAVMALKDPWVVTMLVEGIAELSSSQSPVLTARIYGAADAFRTAVVMPLLPAQRADHDRTIAGIRDALGPDAFASAWRAGAAMSIDEAIALVLAIDDAARPEPGAEAQPADLTPREAEVLGLIIEGQSDKEIAMALGMSRRTASKHVATILGKLGVASRTAAATRAIRERMV